MILIHLSVNSTNKRKSKYKLNIDLNKYLLFLQQMTHAVLLFCCDDSDWSDRSSIEHGPFVQVTFTMNENGVTVKQCDECSVFFRFFSMPSTAMSASFS